MSYMTLTEADALAASIPGLTAWAAATTAAKTTALNRASDDIDAAMPYQGRPYDAEQDRQFPRLAYEGHDVGAGAAAAGAVPALDIVWDWDETTDEAVVPQDVLMAVLYQADANLAGAREARLSAQHDGVVYDLNTTTGDAESYKRTTGPGVTTGLCRPAWMLMRKYRLRSGKLL